MEDKISFREVFVNGNFFSFWIGQIVSQFGERLSQMALIGLIYQAGLTSTGEMSKLLFAMIAPVFIFSPIAGVYVDRWDRKKTLIFSDISRALFIIIIPILLQTVYKSNKPNMLVIYIIVFLVFSATRFFIPAKSAIIPEIMKKEHLRMANSISSTTKMIATVLGVLLGGFIVTMWGAIVCFYLDALTFVISALSLLFIKREFKPKKTKRKISSISAELKLIINQLFDGIKEIKQNKQILYLVKIFSILMAGCGAIFVIFPVFVNVQFKTQTDGLSLLISFLGAGLFVGAIILGKVFKNATNKKIINFSTISVGALFVILANLNHIFPACAIMFLIGIVGIPVIVCTETLIHEMVESEKIGRVYSSFEIIIHAFFLIAMTITGLFGDIASPGYIFSILGASFSIIMLSLFTHELYRNKKIN